MKTDWLTLVGYLLNKVETRTVLCFFKLLFSIFIYRLFCLLCGLMKDMVLEFGVKGWLTLL